MNTRFENLGYRLQDNINTLGTQVNERIDKNEKIIQENTNRITEVEKRVDKYANLENEIEDRITRK